MKHKKPILLIVEDLDFRWRELRAELKKRYFSGTTGLQVVRATTAPEAIRSFQQNDVLVLILDSDLDADGSAPGSGSGSDVVSYLERQAQASLGMVFVTSKREAAGAALTARLVAAGYCAAWMPLVREVNGKPAFHDASEGPRRSWKPMLTAVTDLVVVDDLYDR